MRKLLGRLVSEGDERIVVFADFVSMGDAEDDRAGGPR